MSEHIRSETLAKIVRGADVNGNYTILAYALLRIAEELEDRNNIERHRYVERR